MGVEGVSFCFSVCARVCARACVCVSEHLEKRKGEEDETDSTRLEERTWGGGVQLVHRDRTYVKFFTSNSFLGLERVVCFSCIVTIDFDFIPFSL